MGKQSDTVKSTLILGAFALWWPIIADFAAEPEGAVASKMREQVLRYPVINAVLSETAVEKEDIRTFIQSTDLISAPPFLSSTTLDSEQQNNEQNNMVHTLSPYNTRLRPEYVQHGHD